MKRLVLIVVLFVSMLVSVYAAGLNASAQGIKDKTPSIYSAVRSRAIGEWKDDHAMVLYEINKQADAILWVATHFEDHSQIILSAIFQWADDSPEEVIDFINEDADLILELSVDWSMVQYEAKKQIIAEAAY